ncbi:MAG TPA: phage holin family protein [Streptosporangiaceae bacterium]|nr:phage holin family protein [Streptosporangiaceae bacterium]
MKIVIHVIITALAVWVATVFIHGIGVTAHTTAGKVGTLLAVAVIFGIVNAVLKPIIKAIGCAFYILTLGLIALVVNALLFLLVGYLAHRIDLPFHVHGFVAALLGALLVGIVSWLLGLITGDNKQN